MTTPASTPSRLSTYAGSAAAVMMLLSAPAHSLMGWPVMQAQLAQVNAPADLQLGLQVGWHFGGAAMIAFALIVLHTLRGRSRGTVTSVTPLRVIAALYLIFGAAALAISGDPFFLVFIVPGTLVGVASVA
jgi:hypothetical protein